MATVQLDNIGITLMGRPILRHLTAQVQQGEQVLLTGANGAGKTTLLRVLATALRPQRGCLSLFGGSSRAQLLAARPRLTLMTHQHHFYEPLTALQNLQLVARLSGSETADDHQQLLTQVGLWRHRHRPVAGFSAGMKRRLALARVQLLCPELVLVDEPFGQLDGDGVALMQDALKGMAARGATVVMATHDIALGEALCRVRWHLSPGARGMAVSQVSPS